MASADLRKELDCSLCLNLYNDPITLICGHNYCRACINPVLDKQEASGVYSCPQCRQEFPARPALIKNVTLNNMVMNLQAAHPPLKETDPNEPHKCPIHGQLLAHYCTEDGVCLCASCNAGEGHRGHRLESLDDAAEEKKKKLRAALQNKMTKKKETQSQLELLQEPWRKIKAKVDGETESITDIFRDLKRHLEDLEKRILGEISRQPQWVSVSDMKQQMEVKMEELSLQMGHIEKLCNTTDPMTVLQDPDLADLCDVQEEGEKGQKKGGGGRTLKASEGHNGHRGGDLAGLCYVQEEEGGGGDTSEGHNGHGGGDLDVEKISHTLKTFSDIILGVHPCFHNQGSDNISLNSNTAGGVIISGDGKGASRAQNFGKVKSESFQEVPQVLSKQSFSSGRHYWEADVSKTSDWCVGVSYPSIPRRGNQSRIGNNNKSWGLYEWKGQYSVIHDCKAVLLLNKMYSNKVRVYLDYEAGQISFYDMSDPIRHLHTFTTTFTEPLHAALGVWQCEFDVFRKSIPVGITLT